MTAAHLRLSPPALCRASPAALADRSASDDLVLRTLRKLEVGLGFRRRFSSDVVFRLSHFGVKLSRPGFGPAAELPATV